MILSPNILLSFMLLLLIQLDQTYPYLFSSQPHNGQSFHQMPFNCKNIFFKLKKPTTSTKITLNSINISHSRLFMTSDTTRDGLRLASSSDIPKVAELLSNSLFINSEKIVRHKT